MGTTNNQILVKIHYLYLFDFMGYQFQGERIFLYMSYLIDQRIIAEEFFFFLKVCDLLGAQEPTCVHRSICIRTVGYWVDHNGLTKPKPSNLFHKEGTVIGSSNCLGTLNMYIKKKNLVFVCTIFLGVNQRGLCVIGITQNSQRDQIWS